jgi:subfamily B ATP-binding cassette protein HlyB/CyaB
LQGGPANTASRFSRHMEQAQVEHIPVEFLGAVEIFSPFTPAELQELAKSAQLRSFEFGETVYNAGDPGDGLYVIKSGAVRIFTEEQGKEISMGVRKAGEVFGEMAVLRDYPHESSVRSSSRTELLFFPRDCFRVVLDANAAAQAFIASYVAISSLGGFVSRLFKLRGKVDKNEIEEYIRSVGIKRVGAGKVILEQGGAEDRRLYVLRQGRVRIVRTEGEAEYPLGNLEQGEIFGEKSCLMRQEQPATAIAESDVVLLVIPERTVHFILERNPRLREVLEERIRFFERDLERQKVLSERRNRPLMLDLWSRPESGERIIRRFRLVEQAEEMDCGAACLAMICRHYNIPMTLGKLRELANVTREGATLESLARVGESLGFTTRGVQCTFQALLGFDLPFVAHWEGYHYIIVYGLSKHHVWVADPGAGFRKLTVAEFEKGWTGTCLLFTPGNDMVQLAAARSPWLRFIGYLKPYKKILTHLFVATFVIQILGVAPPVIIQHILDEVIVHENISLLHVLIVGLILANVFTQLTTLMRAFLSNFMIRNMDFSMMSGFLKHALSLPVPFFAKRKTGDILARFQENQTIRSFLTESTVSTLLNLLMVFIYFTILFIYNVKMTVVLLVLVMPILVMTVTVTPRLKAYARDAFQASTDAQSMLTEIIGGAETIRGMGIERPMRLKWEKKYAHALDVGYRAQRFNILVGLMSQLMNATVTISILWMGVDLVLEKQLTIGQLVAFNALMGSVMSPLLGLVALWNRVNEAGVAMERLGDILEMEPEQKPQEIASRVLLPELKGDVELNSVYFRYGGNETPYVLENISFHMRSGELVAIVGQSGSGKTTLAKMLVGFYLPTEGTLTVDGYDMTVIDKEYYRAQVGYVMQTNLLFSGTVAENIASGDQNPDRNHIIEVAKQADAHGFISKMPLGYEQVVGERGVGLSGGQLQRLCIARALYHNPRLLIFDEATSALDTHSESNILRNMQQILKGRTAVVIAHRLSTIMHADKILVLYNGSIVEEGNHGELVEKRGMYYQLVKKQIANS